MGERVGRTRHAPQSSHLCCNERLPRCFGPFHPDFVKSLPHNTDKKDKREPSCRNTLHRIIHLSTNLKMAYATPYVKNMHTFTFTCTTLVFTITELVLARSAPTLFLTSPLQCKDIESLALSLVIGCELLNW